MFWFAFGLIVLLLLAAYLYEHRASVGEDLNKLEATAKADVAKVESAVSKPKPAAPVAGIGPSAPTTKG